jgi:hypothetical protein
MIYDLDGMLPKRAFQRDARGHIKPQGGGGPSAPANQNVTTTSIPEYARPYVEKTLGRAEAVMDEPYQAYGGQRNAAFTPMQAKAMQDVANMQTSGQVTDASNIAYQAGQAGLGAQQNAMNLQNTALGYGQAGAGYGAAASQYGAEGAQQAQQASQQAQRNAQMYGQMGAGYGAQGAEQAAQAQRVAEGQADMYGQMGAGFGAQAAGLAPEAQRYGAGAAQMGQAGMDFGAQGAGIGQRGVSAAEQGFGAGDAYRQQATSAEAMGQYMSPYMQNVVDVQAKEARRQADISQQGNKSRAVAAGAFGGNRAALVEAESERGLQDRIAGIQAQGSQSAYDKAQQAQQFASNVGLQGLQAGYQGLQTGMQGTGQGIQGAQAGMQGQEAGMRGIGQAGQMYGLGMQGAGLGLQGTGQRLAAANVGLAGTGQGMQGSQIGLSGVGQQIAGGQLGAQGSQIGIQGQEAGMRGAQTGLSGVQAATGAGQMGISGLSTANQSAGQLGQLGQTEFGQNQAITDAQMRAGTMQQGQEQKGLDQMYQQFLEERGYDKNQVGFMHEILRGLPISQQTTSQYQNPSMLSQGAGLATAGYGLYQMGQGRANGGQIRASDGLDTLGLYNAMRKG